MARGVPRARAERWPFELVAPHRKSPTRERGLFRPRVRSESQVRPSVPNPQDPGGDSVQAPELRQASPPDCWGPGTGVGAAAASCPPPPYLRGPGWGR